MDINIALIRAIQEFPVLFEKTGSFQQKMEAWKELAKQFDMSEKSLRARWHSLLRNFLKDAKYKYGDEMSYLLPHLGIEQNLTGIETRKEWPYAIVPEFDIAEEDINKICVNKRQVHVEVEHVTNKVDVVVMKKEPVLNEITALQYNESNKSDGEKEKLLAVEVIEFKESIKHAIDDEDFLKLIASEIKNMDDAKNAQIKNDILRILFP
ncbi:uncharacterized protein LOC119684710 [Teleopsis dalmanni]|uniref:uncharacterized protein LOC119663478 n=1 Tax=Teleopsis dalmanni TaxID=139649 RepID=UPI0018CE9ED5|nr:uncharacterized protein LOC119663478 [Teleopsis dalmanni]XP_037954690.1 uncharacterized protein LOC119684668 [Teleopsis dalmanni]XP_037954736.1 uncharacterized protein LOC119684710 [Teleopsis dalmanni]